MFQLRVTKYDPAFRNAQGHYLRDEWTSYGDIGCPFGGVILTQDAYQRVEDAYVSAAIEFLREAGIRSLSVAGLENARGVSLNWIDGSVVSLDELVPLLRRILRDEFWCRLEGPEAFVHVGYDYYLYLYLYLGVPRECADAEQAARTRGLFVEPFPSPYRDPA